jgi:hypothetical protein
MATHRKQAFLSEFGAEMGIKDTRADLTPEARAGPILQAYQDGVKPEAIKGEVRRLFPNVTDFDNKYFSALNVLANAPKIQGNDLFGRSLAESRGFLGFLRLAINIAKPAVQAIQDPSKIPEIVEQQFNRLVVANAPENLKPILQQVPKVAKEAPKAIKKVKEFLGE